MLAEVPVDAAGEQRGCGGKISADQARALWGIMHERMSAPIAARFVLVDTEGWFWIRTVSAPRDGDPCAGGLHQSTREGATFAASCIVEAVVVHGIDLTQALAGDSIATPEGIAATAAILDDLLARRTVPGRPAELSDDLDWVLVASGRAESGDARLPLIG